MESHPHTRSSDYVTFIASLDGPRAVPVHELASLLTIPRRYCGKYEKG